MAEFRSIAKGDLADVVALCEAEGWPSFAEDPERAWRALTAPGVTAVVAVASGRVVGFVQMQSDGVIQAHLSLVLVEREHRGQGIGTKLVREAFRLCGAERVDAITDSAPGFYRSFAHKWWNGFRIYPQYDKGRVPGHRLDAVIDRQRDDSATVSTPGETARDREDTP